MKLDFLGHGILADGILEALKENQKEETKLTPGLLKIKGKILTDFDRDGVSIPDLCSGFGVFSATFVGLNYTHTDFN